MNIGFVKREIARRGIPQCALAKAVKVSHSEVSRWLNSWIPVPKKHRRRLARFLGVRMDELFPRNGGRP